MKNKIPYKTAFDGDNFFKKLEKGTKQKSIEYPMNNKFSHKSDHIRFNASSVRQKYHQHSLPQRFKLDPILRSKKNSSVADTTLDSYLKSDTKSYRGSAMSMMNKTKTDFKNSQDSFGFGGDDLPTQRLIIPIPLKTMENFNQA